MQYYRSIDPITIYPLCHSESFYPSLLLFLFDWWMKRWEIAEEMSMNCMAYTYYVILMAKCTCTWLHHPLKLLTSTMFLPCTDSSKPGWFHVKSHMCILGCNLPIQLLLKSLSNAYKDRLVDRFHHVQIHVTNYWICNILCLKNRLTHFGL